MSRTKTKFLAGVAAALAMAGAAALTIGTTSTSAAAATAAPTTAPVKPVASLNLTRYLGQWYQVAAIPQIFEVQCAGDSIAQYTANADGTVGVKNTCRTWWGSSSVVSGAARVQNAPANSVLTVSFLNVFGQQLYFGGPNYEVMGLDSQYSWAVVVSPDRASAFVLSRTPALTATAVAATRSTLTANGISPCALNTTPQTGGITVSRAFC